MKRYLLPVLMACVLLGSLTLGAVALTAQGFAYNCFGTVRNNTDAAIYVTVKGQTGLGTYIGPHSTERICSGR